MILYIFKFEYMIHKYKKLCLFRLLIFIGYLLNILFILSIMIFLKLLTNLSKFFIQHINKILLLPKMLKFSNNVIFLHKIYEITFNNFYYEK